MKFLRHALFAVLLLLTQTGLLAHGFEHLRSDADTPASHACSLCIAAQGLDSALAAATPGLAPSDADFARPAGIIVAVLHPLAIFARARAPPAA